MPRTEAAHVRLQVIVSAREAAVIRAAAQAEHRSMSGLFRHLVLRHLAAQRGETEVSTP